MRKLFQFNKISIHILCPICMIFCWLFRTAFGYIITKGIPNEIKLEIDYFLSFITIFSDLLAGGTSYFIRYCSNKPIKSIKLSSSYSQEKNRVIRVPILLIQDSTEGRNLILLSLIMFSLSLIESSLVFVFIYYFSKDNNTIAFQLKIIQIFLSWLLTKLVLKHPTYKHKKLGILLISLSTILITMKILINLTWTNVYEMILPIILAYFFFAVKDVTEKWLMENKYKTESFLLLIEGSIGSALYLIVYLFLFNFTDLSFISFQIRFGSSVYNNCLTGSKVYILLLYFISSGGFILLLLLTNKLYSPTSRSVADNVSSFLVWLIIPFIENDLLSRELWEFVLEVIGYVILIFGNSIYNEVLLIYWCNLASMTQKEITRRGALESMDNINEIALPQEDNNLR